MNKLTPAPVFDPASTETYNGWTMRRAGNSYYVFDSDGFFVYAHRAVGSRVNLIDARATINKSLDLIAVQDMRVDPENKQTASNNRFLMNCKKLLSPTSYRALAERYNLVSPRSAYELVMQDYNSLAAGKAVLYFLMNYDSRKVDIDEFNRRFLACWQHPAIVRNDKTAPAAEGWVDSADKPEIIHYNGYLIQQLTRGYDSYIVTSPDGEQLNPATLRKADSLKLADEHNNARLMAEIKAERTGEPKPAKIKAPGGSFFDYTAAEFVEALSAEQMAALLVELHKQLSEADDALAEMTSRKAALKNLAELIINAPPLLPSEKADYRERARKLAARPGGRIMARKFFSRSSRYYLIDFCAAWVCQEDKGIDTIDMQAVIEGRVAEYDQRGFKLGAYYNALNKAGYRRLVRAIEREITLRRGWSTAQSRRGK